MEKLVELRTAKKLSQRALAKEIGCSQNMISQWENGTRDPGTETLQALADYFNVSVDFLLGRDGTTVTTNKEPDEEAIELAKQIKSLPPELRENLEQQVKIWHSLDKK